MTTAMIPVFIKARLFGIDLNKPQTKRDADGVLIRPYEGPIVAEANNVKRLACPNCREVANVSWGRAENLPQVFALLR